MSRMILAVGSLITSPPPSGTQWYIDNAISSSGDGRSWSTAWKSFGNIAWGSIRPGDTINISGGTNGKTYTGGMNVGASGSAGSPILIRSAVDAGHNGIVTVYNDGSIQAGFFMNNIHDITIRGFTITTPTYLATQTDGIYMQTYGTSNNAQNIIIENNVIIISNGEGTGHDDCIQGAWRVTNLTIRNNYMEQRNTKSQGYAQGMWLEGCNGDIRIYNNIVYLPNSKNTCCGTRKETNGDYSYNCAYNAYIYNNTFVGGDWGSIIIKDAANCFVKNNIVRLHHTDTGQNAIWLDSPDPSTANIDYNVYYATNNTPYFHYHTQYLSWNAWRANGFDANSQKIDPQLVDISGLDFRIQSTSPAINAGASDQNVPNTDYAGNARVSPPDVGAYEYVA